MAGDAAPTHGCPVVHTNYRVSRPIFEHYALLNADRELGRVLYADSGETPFWMITRHDDVLEALQTPEVFGNEVVNALNPWHSTKLLPADLDPPEHTLLRKPLNRWFAPAAVQRIGPVLASRCAELVDQLVPRGECDLVSELAIVLPTEIFLRMSGLPPEDAADFIVWNEKMLLALSGVDLGGAVEAEASMRNYITLAIEDRLRVPRDPATDILAHLLFIRVDGEHLDHESINNIMLLLVAAGVDTVRSALGYIFHHFATHPADRQRIVNDPSLTPKAVEELLRLYPLVFHSGRMVRRDIDFHGCPMRQGDVAWLGLASANRDPRKYADPDDYVPGRDHLNQHLTFGAGPHRCLGLHLARHELTVIVNEWHRRIPNYEIATDETLMERGCQLSLEKLPLRWSLQ